MGLKWLSSLSLWGSAWRSHPRADFQCPCRPLARHPQAEAIIYDTTCTPSTQRRRGWLLASAPCLRAPALRGSRQRAGTEKCSPALRASSSAAGRCPPPQPAGGWGSESAEPQTLLAGARASVRFGGEAWMKLRCGHVCQRLRLASLQGKASGRSVSRQCLPEQHYAARPLGAFYTVACRFQGQRLDV